MHLQHHKFHPGECSQPMIKINSTNEQVNSSNNHFIAQHLSQLGNDMVVAQMHAVTIII